MRMLIGIIVGVLASASIAGAAAHMKILRMHYHDLAVYGSKPGVGCLADRRGSIACVTSKGHGYACTISPTHLGVFRFGPNGVSGNALFWRDQP